MAKQSLSSVKSTKANAQAATLGAAAAELGDILGNYVCESRIAGATVELMVKERLDFMMQHGLTVDDSIDMLKAPSSKWAGELYTIMVEAMNAPLWAQACIDLDVDSLTDEQRAQYGMAKGRRDKYMSKCRAYVRNRGNLPLDLHDNAYRAKKAKDKQQPAAQQPEQPEEQEAKQVAFTAKPAANDAAKPVGLAALRDFLADWVAANNEIAKAGGELESIADLADDLLDAVKLSINKVQAKSGGKKNK